jgi:Zn-dependent protease
MNLILFILSMVVMFFITASALSKVPALSVNDPSGLIFRADYMGRECLFALEGDSYYYIPLKSLLQMLPYASDYLVKPVFGEIPGYLYQMLGYFAMTNLVLCLFNLLPVPPLDGYHVLNDLLLRRRQLFANPQTARIASTVLFVLVITGVVGRGIGWLDAKILAGAGNVAASILKAFGLM